MIFSIPNVLSLEELTEIEIFLKQAEFVDGKLTAGWHAKLVKHNQQLKGNLQTQGLKAKIVAALKRNALFQTAVRPKQIHSLLFSRYEPGMSYDRHIDNALMGNDTMWRSDLSFTLFLSSPTDYQGGELVIEEAQDDRSYKLDTNSVIIYPSTTLHRVNPVTEGTRLVVVGWVHSLIRNAGDREILFDLETARRSIFASAGKTPEFDLISKSIANLLRKWADV
ncbi:Fe2+-dependent dioxygenase [Myxosarcina sp. GI1]|uniref:Fe2+-dependent dioxygenase n=1 Tax=Myxosarcina sp. GI1 TaxID=1541065 RepID=UPI00056A942F|nr:Fe2+-dependent dioxygenase [Myxosarcina sp. GI1]